MCLYNGCHLRGVFKFMQEENFGLGDVLECKSTCVGMRPEFKLSVSRELFPLLVIPALWGGGRKIIWVTQGRDLVSRE